MGICYATRNEGGVIMEDPKPRIDSSPVVMWVSKIIDKNIIGKVNPDSRIGQNWQRLQNLKILEEKDKNENLSSQ